MSSMAIGWARVVTHLGVIMAGQVLDELAGQIPGNAAVADDDPGPDDGHRDAGRSEQMLGLAAAAEVCRQGFLVVAEPSEVDARSPARAPACSNAAAAAASLRSKPASASECTR